jgi:hypothetical protein
MSHNLLAYKCLLDELKKRRVITNAVNLKYDMALRDIFSLSAVEGI